MTNRLRWFILFAIFLAVAWLCPFLCYGATTAPTTQTINAIQSALNSDNAVDEAVLLKSGKAVGDVKAVHPSPVTQPTEPTYPAFKTITQTASQWYSFGSILPVNISNVCITNGGLLLLQNGTNPLQSVTLTNVWNIQGSDQGGMYFVMLWPPHNNIQQAIPHCVWDNTNCPHPVMQGKDAECILRVKCDDLRVINVHFVGWQDNGVAWKQLVELRHGKSMAFTGCTFTASFPDIGEQKTANPDGTSSFDTSQHIGTVTFTNCVFTLWTPGNAQTRDVILRHPGVDHIVFENCADPSGAKFSKSE